MAYQVTMPQMGYDMTEGKINRWLVEEGQEVARGDVIASIATEKADIDIEAYASGVLRRILVQPGATVPVGQAIAIIADATEELDGAPEPSAPPEAKPLPTAPEPPPAEADRAAAGNGRIQESAQQVPEPPTPVPGWARELGGEAAPEPSASELPEGGGRIKASPLAKRRARELGVSLATVRATGPGGRVRAEDVEAAARGGVGTAQPQRAGVVALPLDASDPSEPVQLSRMREAIGRRMVEAKSSIPHFYLTTEAAVGGLTKLRAELNQLGDPELPRFSVTDFIVRAMALTLQRHPSLNAAWIGNGLRQFSQSNIALAVALPDGLVAPVLRGCETLPFAELARRTHDLAARAKSNRLRPEELSGGHTAISNLGMFGISQFAAIITPGQGSVLAVGEVKEVPVVVDGQLVPGQRMAMTLAIDHRVTDGAQAAEALAYLRWCLEHPAACLI